jgi:mevalonate pyrophosphate decarboxylase
VDCDPSAHIGHTERARAADPLPAVAYDLSEATHRQMPAAAGYGSSATSVSAFVSSGLAVDRYA